MISSYFSIHFRGIALSHIFFKCTRDEECENGKWVIQSLINPEVMLELANADFVMGRQKWNPAQGKTICKHKTGNFIQLTFSQCYPGKFTCDSGQCVPLDERCNIEMNCEDQKDEYNCAGIKIGNEYASEKMPVSVTAEPTIIYINVSLLAFPSISTKHVKFSADFYLNLQWHDLRIKMWNLDHDHSKNSLSKEELDGLWKPKLAFVNTLSQLYPIQPLQGTLIKESDPFNEDTSLAIEGNNENEIYLTHKKPKRLGALEVNWEVRF